MRELNRVESGRLLETNQLPSMGSILQVQRALKDRNLADAKTALRAALAQDPTNPVRVPSRAFCKH